MTSPSIIQTKAPMPNSLPNTPILSTVTRENYTTTRHLSLKHSPIRPGHINVIFESLWPWASYLHASREK